MRAWMQTARRHRLRILGVALGLLLVTVILWSLVVPQRDSRSEDFRKRGYPATLAELDAWYPAVPPAENAALIYTNAFAHLINTFGAVTNLFSRSWLPSRGQRLAAQEKADLASLFEANREAVRLLHAVPATARSRYPLDLTGGYTLALPHLAQSKHAVLLLATQALVQAGDGDAEAATRSFLAAGQVSESLAEEPFLITQRVRAADWEILLTRIEYALSLTTFTDGQLAALQRQILAADRPQAALRGWVTEWVGGNTLFHDRRIMDSAIFGHASIAPNAFPVLTHLAPWARHCALTLLRFSGQQQKDETFYMDYVSREVAAKELPYPARLAASKRLASITNVPNRCCIFSQMLLSARGFLDFRDADLAARLRTAATALAIERFRLAHANRLPDSLAELSPACIDRLPTDPFDGQPLHYRTNATGYVVYCVGTDLHDDGAVDWDDDCRKSPQDISAVVKH